MPPRTPFAHPARRSGQSSTPWFDLTVPERAYLFGLLQTDGCHTAGSRNRGRIQIELAAVDADVLERLMDLCPWYSSVRYRTRDTNFATTYRTATWSLSSWDARSELTDLGLPPGPKAATVAPPSVPLAGRDYLRGLIDGDGSLGFTGKGLPFVSFVSASEALTRYVEAEFERITGVRRSTNRNARDGVFNPMLQTEAAVELATHLYRDGDLAITRKANSARSMAGWVRPEQMRRAYTARRWTPEEDALVLASESVREVADLLGRTVRSVSMRRWRLRSPDAEGGRRD